ncbi:hypothetical protein thsps21_38850 [Pseudomonas sp. No.21]|jgi:hypothetical protein|uniref:hypothetical protein n=1 Tax=Pseudomonas TaxID=286 RepID=UPI000DA8E9F8|nr:MULTISPECIES: hypothetical protein [Pseudomonas]MDW3711301.1 hypothetical protein [Pseudomonas sp. 2023EL-01195]PZE11366.1 hypothetical protein DMX10_21045 [Pseudomonas sp. 57B-090624]GJN49284.1 hypothetical protein TUM20249_52700 [Pseudomonas tohonis]
MEWLISYSFKGEARHMKMNTRDIPNIKAIGFSIYTLEFPGKARPSRSSEAIQDWLTDCGIEVTDVRLLRRSAGPGPEAPYSQLLPGRNGT